MQFALKLLLFTAFTAVVGVIGLSLGEWALVTFFGIVLFCANQIPTFLRGMKRGVKEFEKASRAIPGSLGGACQPTALRPAADALTHTNQTVETDPPPETAADSSAIVWFAQGFGVGRLLPAPGTWGSLVGVTWFAVLVTTGSLPVLIAGVVVSIPVSAWACGGAELLLRQKDPPSVVLDEIIAMPVCFAGWVLSVISNTGRIPEVSYFFTGNHWLGVAGIFAAFRLFDIWKPWPVRQSQSLPGGWGVTVDDLLAALYVNLVSLPFLL